MTRPPAWLAEFHRQWQKVRGHRAEPAAAPFGRNWEDLLDAAGLRTAEERAAAAREAGAFADRLVFTRHRYRGFIQRVRLPFESEPWLRALFESNDPAVLRQSSLGIVMEFLAREHPLLPGEWRAWCGSLIRLFAAGKSHRPFHWRQPENVRALLSLLHSLTSREWPHGTLVRDASVALGLDSKAIERRLHAMQSALGWLMHGTPERGPLPLESLGILTTNSRLLFDGPLTLHFADGSCDESRNLRHGDFVTAADLERAVRITTTASRILSVENSKTTFRNLAAQNEARDTLIIATSFPTRAVRLLLEKLPLPLPHWHFGDTDPAGYFILLKLRQLTTRPVSAWQMDWRDDEHSAPLSPYDLRVLQHLLTHPSLPDVQPDLCRMREAGRKGDYEQESRDCLIPDR